MLVPNNLQQISANPESLNPLTLPELRALWAQCCPKQPPSTHRCFLLRDLAFVAQCGGSKLPRDTDVMIKTAMRAASVIRSPEEQQPTRTRPATALATQGVPVGAQLVREWGGQSHEVTVLGGGWYQYQNRSYKSLTQVAKVITGAHWSGPRFFGLHRCRQAS